MLSKDIESNDDNNERPDRPVNQSYGEIFRSTRSVEKLFILERRKKKNCHCMPPRSKQKDRILAACNKNPFQKKPPQFD